MKKKKLLLAALVAVLIMTMGIGSTWAYFTTYAEAQGSKEVQFGYETYIDEKIVNLDKVITVYASEKSEPVFVRVRAFTGLEYQDRLSISGQDWTKGGDGYYYYNKPIAYGEGTAPLNISVGKLLREEELDAVNVIVLDESTPGICEYAEDGSLVRDADGKAILHPDWEGDLIIQNETDVNNNGAGGDE